MRHPSAIFVLKLFVLIYENMMRNNCIIKLYPR